MCLNAWMHYNIPMRNEQERDSTIMLFVIRKYDAAEWFRNYTRQFYRTKTIKFQYGGKKTSILM